MTSKSCLALLCAGSAFALGSAVHAEPGQPISGPAPVTSAISEPALPALSENPFGGAGVVDEKALRAVSGMANLQQHANANNSSVVAGNTVEGQSVTGEIAFDGQAFHNLHGLSILTANTGNNVSINAAMNVNVSIQQ